MFADLVALLSLVKQLDKWERFSCFGRSQNFAQAVDVAADKFGDREGLVVLQQNIKRNFAELKTEIEVTWTSWSRFSCQHCHPGFGCRTYWIGTEARGEAGHMGAKHSWMVFLHIIWTSYNWYRCPRYLTQFAAAKAGLILVNITSNHQFDWWSLQYWHKRTTTDN